MNNKIKEKHEVKIKQWRRSMVIRVLLFAELQERIGQSTLDIAVETINVLRLKRLLEQDYPSLNLQKVMTAVNEEYANDEDSVNAGDTVAFIPPVSGG